MYAVIETGSKQYRVEVGTELEVELLDVEPGQTITLERVLLVADGDTAAIGRPIVDGAKVSAEVVRRERGDKLISFKYRPKARRRVKKGHRQELTIIRVADIVFGGKSAAEGSLARSPPTPRPSASASRRPPHGRPPRTPPAAKLAEAAAPKVEVAAKTPAGAAKAKVDEEDRHRGQGECCGHRQGRQGQGAGAQGDRQAQRSPQEASRTKKDG